MKKMKMVSMEDFKNSAPTEDKIIKVENGKHSTKIHIIEDVKIDDLHNAVEAIVDAITDQDFAYTLFDILLPYHVINLFTNIEVPKIQDDIPDYGACYKFCVHTELIDEIEVASPVVSQYIGVIVKNVWRRLEYKKTLASLIPYESLISALDEFYKVLDEIDELAEAHKNIDVDALMNQIQELNTGLNAVKEKEKVSKDTE